MVRALLFQRAACGLRLTKEEKGPEIRPKRLSQAFFELFDHTVCGLADALGGGARPSPSPFLYQDYHMLPEPAATGPHFVPRSPHVTLIQLRLALISYQDHHMLP